MMVIRPHEHVDLTIIWTGLFSKYFEKEYVFNFWGQIPPPRLEDAAGSGTRRMLFNYLGNIYFQTIWKAMFIHMFQNQHYSNNHHLIRDASYHCTVNVAVAMSTRVSSSKLVKHMMTFGMPLSCKWCGRERCMASCACIGRSLASRHYLPGSV